MGDPVRRERAEEPAQVGSRAGGTQQLLPGAAEFVDVSVRLYPAISSSALRASE